MKSKVSFLNWLKRTGVAMIALVAGIAVAVAQTKTVSGTVVDASGEPVIGANVVVVGTTDGATTDIDGNFSIAGVKNDAQLKVSFIGYETQTISVAGRSKVNVTLREAGEDLDEVVVIGYGAVKKRDLTGSVASVSAESLTKLPVSDVSQALQGKMPGVSVTSQDGRPGAEVSIRVRGGGSITQSNDPLFIVDGFPVSSISDIPADQIESIDVLKDASSTAIYGARGANGVILVTTKGVKDGKVSVSYSGYVQTKKVANTLDVLSAQDYMKYWWGYTDAMGEPYAPSAGGFAKYYGLGAAYGNHYGDYAGVSIHDYTDDILRTAFTHSHNINLTGGTDKTKIAFNANYIDDEGIKINSDYRRTNLSLKVQQQVVEGLTADFDVRYSSSRTNGVEGNPKNGRGTVLSGAYMYMPIDNPLGGVDFSEVSGGFGLGSDYIDYSNGTPVDLINEVTQRAYRENLRGTGSLTWEVIKGVKLRSELGYSRGHNQTNYYEAGLSRGNKYARVAKSDSETFRNVNTIDWQVQGLGKDHSLGFLLGHEVLRSLSNSNSMTGEGYPDNFDYKRAIGLIQMYTKEQGGSFINTIGIPAKTVSFFARGNYSYKGRYLLTATFRADGSSKFAPDNRWGFFPAAALAWRISDEEWMEQTEDWLDNLKLRLSYGASGSDNISSSLWQETWVSSTTTVGGVTTSVYKPEGLLANPDLKWETTISRNLGLDFGFWNGRLSGSIDTYWNETKDLLMRVPIDATTGYSYQFKNIGKTSNKGVEIALSADVFRNDDWRVNVSATYNYNRNKIEELEEGVTTLYGTQWASSSTSPNYDYTFTEGKAVGLIRAYKSLGWYTTDDFNYADGVYTLKEGVADMPAVDKGYGSYPVPAGLKAADGQTALPGFMKLADEDGDGQADIEEFEVNPRHTGGFSINVNYRQFDFTAQFNYVIGGNIYNVGRLLNMYGDGNTRIGANRLDFVKDCYQYYSVQNGELVAATTPDELNAINGGAKFYSNNLAYGVATSDFIEDGSYLRLQNLTLGYTLPKKVTKKVGAQRLRVYFTGGNLFCLTGYKGLDPEVNAVPTRTANNDNNPGGFPTPGFDMGTYPRARTFTFGLNLDF